MTTIPTVETVTAAQVADRICQAFADTASPQETTAHSVNPLARKMLTALSITTTASEFYAEIRAEVLKTSDDVFAEWEVQMTQRARDVDTAVCCNTELNQEVLDALFAPESD